jgi:hypothetical protein
MTPSFSSAFLRHFRLACIIEFSDASHFSFHAFAADAERRFQYFTRLFISGISYTASSLPQQWCLYRLFHIRMHDRTSNILPAQ